MPRADIVRGRIQGAIWKWAYAIIFIVADEELFNLLSCGKKNIEAFIEAYEHVFIRK